ncbi:hypothetical protein BAUCODRAFT_144662 [Baudoinia panamericana UAMH 10762]|uniref:Zn(2)-C6 fungal-type domain-containing protein n=1 Tax=Baudoinia panamericana (strain UAMH 10762) TaxID=717646 RepID=M2NQ12_BAUPA|nr:uncharacterized protein BAUCODRAFT_144662 [Baudoinia panamericana UAMH 10762]EMD01091.1 hypothetical protein BAUCODRAFT_144662 [Baudoinia panamericana UAMH 10762]
MQMDPNEAYQTLASLASNQLQPHEESPSSSFGGQQSGGGGGGKRKANDDPNQPQQRSKRNRYISIACNECKRRKIKCNGQTPCQRCGNLQLECIYAPNCCNGFRDTQEYREMAGIIVALQEQVNMLYADLSSLRAQLGQAPPPPLQQAPQPPPQPAPIQHTPQPQQQSNAAIDPSLQSSAFSPPARGGLTIAQAVAGAPVASMSTPTARPHSRQQSFRGPTSAEFNFDVAKSSLQTMGITDRNGEGSGSGNQTADPSPMGSPRARTNANQFLTAYHASKDPLWSITQEEAMRLCNVYEDEMGLMYPVLDITKVVTHATKLYRFMDAAHRTGLMQQGMPGADAIEDDDTNVLKMVLANGLTVEASGRSDTGKRLFEYVQPATENLLLGSVGVKGIRLLILTAMYQFLSDNEGTSWRIIGVAARLCIELGLHRRETYEAMQDESERAETTLLFWSIYVLDRRWSFGTGMPFALQDADIDPHLPKPEDRSPYLMAMIGYSAIGSKVWRAVAATSAPGAGTGINAEDMNYLDYQVIQWHRQIPVHLRFEHPSQVGRLSTPIGPAASRAANRLRILLYLRANQMRILIYRPVLHSATSIMQHREQAQTVVDVAKDTVRVLTHINQTSDLYRSSQVMFNAFLTSALAVLFLAVSHTPALFAENVREEFYMALDLVRGFSKGSWIGKRLWKTIRVLKEVGPKLGLPIKDTGAGAHKQPQQHLRQDSTTQSHQKLEELDMDPSRSAAVAMAGLAGHNVDEFALFGNGNNGTATAQQWATAQGTGSSTSPDGMANDLTSLFEAVGGYQGYDGMGVQNGGFGNIGEMGGEEGLSGIFKELF